MAEKVIQLLLKLWGGMKIPMIVLSGEVNSGKSIWIPLIDPICRVQGVPPTTIGFDQEGSLETYAGSLNFKWFDTRRMVFEGVHRRVMPPGNNDPRWLKLLKTKADVNDSPSASMFRAAVLSMLSIEPGKYRVMGFDTFTPIIEGQVDWLRRHPEAFGRTANQYEKASSMFLWPDVKAMLAHILAVECRLRFETTVLTVHLKYKWEGDKRTKERIAEGLDVLDKLATLHIELQRTPDAQGNVPKEPVGILKKERLVRFGATPDEDMPILPPRIEKCTPDTIRAWIQKPANYSKLKKSERVVIAEPTEIELQQMKLATAEAEAEAATARSGLLDRQKELAAIRQQQAAASQPTDQTAGANQVASEKRQADAAAAELQASLAAQQAEGQRLAATAPPEHQRPGNSAPRLVWSQLFTLLARDSGLAPEKIVEAMKKQGVSRFSELTEQHQFALLTALRKAAEARNPNVVYMVPAKDPAKN